MSKFIGTVEEVACQAVAYGVKKDLFHFDELLDAMRLRKDKLIKKLIGGNE